MNRPISIISLILFSLVILVSSCDSVLGDAKKDEGVQVFGSIYNVLLGDTSSVSQVTLFIDHEEVSVNEKGEFILKLKAGEHLIEILSPEHLSYEETIQIQENTRNVEFEIKPILIDYYDFNVGDIWTFDYLERVEEIYFSARKTGTITWEIIDKEIDIISRDTIFTVKYNFDGDFKKWNSTVGIIDSGAVNTENNFKITQYENGTVLYDKVPGIGDLMTPYDSTFTFIFNDGAELVTSASNNERRFYPKELSGGEDILLDFGKWDADVKELTISPKRGIVKFYVSTPPMHNSRSYGFDLISYIKASE